MMSGRENEDDIDLPTGDEPKRSTAAGSPDELRILEAVLFASDELMTAAHLKTILPSQPDARKVRSMVEKLNVQLQKERHPFEIVEIGGGYQFRTITYYHPWVRQIFREKAAKKLSIQALECLAIIAYKQPISKAEIEMIRGVVSDGAMKTLLEKRLVTITGRSEKPGRPLLYGTTQTFLRYFGLNRREDLPRIEEFEAMAREKMEKLSVDDLEQEEIDMKVEAVGDDDDAVAPEEPSSGGPSGSPEQTEVPGPEENPEDEGKKTHTDERGASENGSERETTVADLSEIENGDSVLPAEMPDQGDVGEENFEVGGGASDGPMPASAGKGEETAAFEVQLPTAGSAGLESGSAVAAENAGGATDASSKKTTGSSPESVG
jgi:segregation and condensation protein B